MAINPQTPLIFEVPDGEIVVCTWPYIISKITPMFEDITASLNRINGSLRTIDTKLDDWIEDEAEPT